MSDPGPLLLLGGQGQIGWELRRCLMPLGEIVAPTRVELDLADPDQLRDHLRALAPALIVNAAAYTDVDGAESAPELAMAVNATAPGLLAEEAARLGVGLVHYSSDYVFDGAQREGAEAPGYREPDPPNPLNLYGQSKLAGEQAIQASGVAHLILRTSWVYAARGRNFLRTIARLARERDELRVVDDQTGSPTWARAIAEATALILAQCHAVQDVRILRKYSGLYHLAATDRTTWHGFAEAILAHLRATRGAEVRAQRVVPISSADYPQEARRPAFSVLDGTAAGHVFGVSLPPWRDQLTLCLEEFASMAEERTDPRTGLI